MASYLPLVVLILLSSTLTKSQTEEYCDVTGGGSTYSETINDIDKTRRIQANGCPNHDNTCLGPTCDGSPEKATPTPKDYYLPSEPCISDIVGGVDVTCIGGPIGVMLNGVSLFSQTAGDGCPNAIEAEFTSFSICGGHSTGTGQYHYHLAPACLLDQYYDSGTTNHFNQHSPQIGWAMDGFPIYGPHGNSGEYIYACGHDNHDPTDCLDECNGHYSSHSSGHEIDGFNYHYHITGPINPLAGKDVTVDSLTVRPDESMYPYTIGCMKGIPNNWKPALFRDATCAVDGVTDNHIAEAKIGASHRVWPIHADGSTNSPTMSPTAAPTVACDSIESYNKVYSGISSFRENRDADGDGVTEGQVKIDETLTAFKKKVLDESLSCEGDITELDYVYDIIPRLNKKKVTVKLYVCCGAVGSMFPGTYDIPNGYSEKGSAFENVDWEIEEDPVRMIVAITLVSLTCIAVIIGVVYYFKCVKNRKKDLKSEVNETIAKKEKDKTRVIDVTSPLTPDEQKMDPVMIVSTDGTRDKVGLATINMMQEAGTVR